MEWVCSRRDDPGEDCWFCQGDPARCEAFGRAVSVMIENPDGLDIPRVGPRHHRPPPSSDG